MDPAKRIESIIAPTLQDMGFDLVQVQLSGAQRRTLQIMAERTGTGDMSVEDCAAISRSVSALLDVEEPIKGRYTLEVSSPGLDRPLTRLQDYDRFAGLEARLELTHSMAGQRRFRGRIEGLSDDIVRLDVEGVRVEIPFADIERAKLILNDELLALAGETQH